MGLATRCAFGIALGWLWAAGAGAALEEPVGRAGVLLEEGQFQSAERELRAAIEADPASARAHHQLGRALAAQGRYAEAAEAYRRAAEQGAQLAGLYRDLGLALFELGEYEGARQALEAGLEADPEDSLTRLQLGLTLLELDRPGAAAAHFDRVGDRDPTLAALALYNAAVAYARADRPSQAGERLQQMLELDPQPAAAQRARSLLEHLGALARSWRVDGSFGLLYDDEVASPEVDGRAGRGDGAGVAELGGSYRFLDDGVHQLEASYDFQQTAYFRASAFDVQAHSFGASGTRSLGPVDLALDYRFSLATLGGDFLLRFHELRPALQWAPLPFLYAVAGPRFTLKELDDPRRDATRYGAGIDAFLLPRVLSEQVPDGSFGRLGLAFEHEAARAAAFDYQGLVLTTGFHLPFGLGGTAHELDVSYRFRWKDYAHRTPAIGRQRADSVHSTRVRLSRQLIGPAALRLDYEFTASESNLPSADFRRNAVMLGLAFSL